METENFSKILISIPLAEERILLHEEEHNDMKNEPLEVNLK